MLGLLKYLRDEIGDLGRAGGDALAYDHVRRRTGTHIVHLDLNLCRLITISSAQILSQAIFEVGTVDPILLLLNVLFPPITTLVCPSQRSRSLTE